MVLTFIAPAERCNQRCPACYIHRLGEPASSFALRPQDFASILEELLADGVPIFGVGFQGYEVTLPKSWPYVVAVFSLAQRHRLRRTFITNGMLLDRHVDSLQQLDPHRIAVSLDAADPHINDRRRGLEGAFLATTRSVRRTLDAVPELAPRLSIASTLYDDENFRSLLGMPSLLRRFGIERWVIGVEADFAEGGHRPVPARTTILRWVAELRSAALAEGIRFHFNDEFGLLGSSKPGEEGIEGTKSLFDPDAIVRVDPAGYLRVGRELLAKWVPDERRRWCPGGRRAAEVIDYRERTGSELEVNVSRASRQSAVLRGED